jgi:Zn-dependent protease with chaperone function
MVATVRVGTSSLLGLAVALGVGLLLVLLLILVGVYLVIFFLVVYAVGLCWNAFKRQQEYSADLFAALTQRTSRHIGMGLLELTRQSGLNCIRASVLEEEIEQRVAAGQFAHMSRAEVEERIDGMVEDFDVEQHVRDHPGAVGSLRELDARHLLERRGLDPFTDEDLAEFATFRYTLGERTREFLYSHPLSGKRVSGVADVSFD